ncbi:hypothetical protein ABIC94_002874 [Variovorax paradoxus]|uniref:hypothetical protein n=1 Tax=Variovorax paradoxus TaxID=34073 RepID=UPI00339A8DE6
MDDFFRSEENGLQSHPINRRFLRGLFYSACQASGIVVREEHPVSSGGRLPVRSLMDRLGLPHTTAGWASAAIANLGPALDELNTLELGKKSLVIGWGLPPSLLNYISSCNATFIDVEVHPLRFARHLHLGVRTNSKRIATIFSQIAVPDETFRNAAIGMKALFSRRGGNALFSPDARVGVFLGQTDVDLALVSSGRLVRPRDVVERVAALAASVDVLAIKPHPCQPGTELLDGLVKKIPNSTMVGNNIYAMLCAENVAFFSGISSGALTEAEYFGQLAERVAEQDRNNPALLPADCSGWFPVGSGVASLRVMKDVLGRSYLPAFLIPKRRYAEAVSTADPNAIDQAFGMRWGLQLDAEGLRSCPKVALDKVVHFGNAGPYAAALSNGWHEPEPWGAWSSEDLASVLLMLDTANLPEHGKVRITVTGTRCPPSGADPFAVELRINGNKCKLARDSETRMVFACDLDSDELRSRPLLTAEFLVKGALRPCDVSDSRDCRRLGFGLHSLKVDVLDASRGDIVNAKRDGIACKEAANALP